MHVGHSIADDTLWLSYKFKNIYVKDLQEVNVEIIELPFGAYFLNRSQNWQHDINGDFIKSKTMKKENNLCPWATTNEKVSNSLSGNINLTNIQKCLGCKLDKSEICNGFCIFPVHGQLNMPNGWLWTVKDYIQYNSSSANYKSIQTFWSEQNIQYETNINQCYIIPSANFEREIFAQTDLTLNDDIQIFFTNDPVALVNQLENNETMDTILDHLSGIFQGFTDTRPQEYSILYQSSYDSDSNLYYYNNYVIANNSPFNGPHTITSGTKLNRSNSHIYIIGNK